MTVLGIREDALEIHEVIKSTDKLLTLKQVVTKWKSPGMIISCSFHIRAISNITSARLSRYNTSSHDISKQFPTKEDDHGIP